MNLPLRRIERGAILLGLILAASIVGYHLLGRDWLDAAYMVVITVASVGFGEHSDLPPAEKIFTMAVIIFGISAALIPGGAIAGLAICVNLVVDWLMKRTSSLKGGRGDA